METVYNNDTQNQSTPSGCEFRPTHIAAFSMIDIVTFITGQPVIGKLLWLVFTSKKTIDILNFNLALFHNFQYFVSIVHFMCLFRWPAIHLDIVKFLFVYVEIGGPMSLTFISLERYCAVVFPTSYPLLKIYRLREICAVSVWLISLPIAFTRIVIEENAPELANFMLKFLPIFIMGFMMSMMVLCTITIVRELKKSGPGRDALHPVKKRALRTVCATSFIIVLCYCPVTIMQQLTFYNDLMYTCVTTPVCIVFLSAASVVHPLFYLSTQGKLCPCLKRGKKI